MRKRQRKMLIMIILKSFEQGDRISGKGIDSLEVEEMLSSSY